MKNGYITKQKSNPITEENQTICDITTKINKI